MSLSNNNSKHQSFFIRAAKCFWCAVHFLLSHFNLEKETSTFQEKNIKNVSNESKD